MKKYAENSTVRLTRAKLYKIYKFVKSGIQQRSKLQRVTTSMNFDEGGGATKKNANGNIPRCLIFQQYVTSMGSREHPEKNPGLERGERRKKGNIFHPIIHATMRKIIVGTQASSYVSQIGARWRILFSGNFFRLRNINNGGGTRAVTKCDQMKFLHLFFFSSFPRLGSRCCCMVYTTSRFRILYSYVCIAAPIPRQRHILWNDSNCGKDGLQISLIFYVFLFIWVLLLISLLFFFLR